ncbi:hypothetical protein MKX03_028829 [Papaver bracteatum]|nr:hypothetical protein MKX03_028829 [Papaver bracteatum]
MGSSSSPIISPRKLRSDLYSFSSQDDHDPLLFLFSFLWCNNCDLQQPFSPRQAILAEMNKLEVEFLFLMGFKLHVNVKVFESYCCHLEREVSIGGGYQIERSLGFMCGGHMKSIKRENNQRNNLMITTSSNVVHTS